MFINPKYLIVYRRATAINIIIVPDAELNV